MLAPKINLLFKFLFFSEQHDFRLCESNLINLVTYQSILVESIEVGGIQVNVIYTDLQDIW